MERSLVSMIALQSPRAASRMLSMSLLMLLGAMPLAGQEEPPVASASVRYVAIPIRPSYPFAGKNEARIGGWRESERDKLRLDIGASIDLLEFRETGILFAPDLHPPVTETMRYSFGADFFTWTRLRSAGRFKFPVEAVDYYFGVNGALFNRESAISDVRLRLAHISAHLVDGDPSFTDPDQSYITYSREFVDLMIGIDAFKLLFDKEKASFHGPVSKGGKNRLRPYLGALWLFHTIPDTLGVITPYAGIDGHWQPESSFPVTLKAGYEARLNTELEPIGEHLLRAGVKLGHWSSNGVTIEGSYYSGRSPYGQHFHRREEFFSIGFSVGM